MTFWTEALVRDLANKLLELNKLFCGSRAISDSFTVSYTVNPPHFDIQTPYYWARYYKDGVDFIRTPKKGKYLIWFVDPEDDPRIAPVPKGYPVRRSDVRPLTKEEYKEARQLQKKGKVVFAESAGPIPAHDWTPDVEKAWAIYMKIRIKQSVGKQVEEVLKPLRGLRIG